jgi:hypothetical protein
MPMHVLPAFLPKKKLAPRAPEALPPPTIAEYDFKADPVNLTSARMLKLLPRVAFVIPVSR